MNSIINVNILATINVVKCVLPTLRSQRSGYIINMGSVAGFVGAPGWSVYSATKAAVAAFSEVLLLDVKEFGIRVTVVEPSGFRTGFLTEKSLAVAPTTIEGYENVRKTKERYLSMNGQQAGDPDRAAEIFIELAENPEPPIHLFLGKDAYNRVREKLDAMSASLEKWKSTSIGADFQN
jgi:short-subunit dehydrogenase